MPRKIEMKGPVVDNDTGWLYEWFGWSCISPGALAKELEEAGGEDVVLEISSPGGYLVPGYEIYSCIRGYSGKVTAHIICACSAATLAACAAEQALISDAAIFMIHNARSAASGDHRDLQMEADALREFDDGIINAYVRKTGMSRNQIQNLMNNDTYMSPQKAIQYGFADGYIFGDPEQGSGYGETDSAESVSRVSAAGAPVIPADRARELIKALRGAENLQKKSTESEKKGERGKMTLKELLNGDQEAQEELDTLIKNARTEGGEAERARMQSLDAIARTVPENMLHDAKYGKNPVDGKTLAYQAMISGERLATAYMADARKDSADSGAGDVGTGNPDAGEGAPDEADSMAEYVNRTKGGKRAWAD